MIRVTTSKARQEFARVLRKVKEGKRLSPGEARQGRRGDRVGRGAWPCWKPSRTGAISRTLAARWRKSPSRAPSRGRRPRRSWVCKCGRDRSVRGGPARIRVTKQARPDRPGTPCLADGRAAIVAELPELVLSDRAEARTKSGPGPNGPGFRFLGCRVGGADKTF